MTLQSSLHERPRYCHLRQRLCATFPSPQQPSGDMRTSSILSAAVACATMVEASLPVLSPLSPNTFDHVNDTQAIEHDSANRLAARAWDPSKVATDATWSTYVQKGQRLKCLMEAPDKGAGWLLKDTRTPPSAASKWSGDITGLKFDLDYMRWHRLTCV